PGLDLESGLDREILRGLAWDVALGFDFVEIGAETAVLFSYHSVVASEAIVLAGRRLVRGGFALPFPGLFHPVPQRLGRDAQALLDRGIGRPGPRGASGPPQRGPLVVL